MRRPPIRLIALAAIAVLTLAAFWSYQWQANPLSQAEIDAYMEQIEAQTRQPGGRHDLAALRGLLESDDGRPVYTVNLYEFHDQADYPPASGFGGTGEEAYARFAQVMVPLMLERGSHPVFSSQWADPSSNGWDRFVIVRYRDRRALVDLFATDAFAEGSLHKWASIRRHERLLVQGIHIPGGGWVIALISLLLTALIGWSLAWSSGRTARPTRQRA
ncbi:hypothetical protein [Maricaulis sp.]|uniref:hypothetical protein n=1 Tax=Maricaulis sp. TaxID=1486257 RepID=UPI002B27027C|nr:hypothetical protein [Maricaulis sp.]